MAKKIQAWVEFGPKLDLGTPISSDELIEAVVAATNQSRGSVLAVLAELDEVIGQGLKTGRIVQFPNDTHFRPTGHFDGSIAVNVGSIPNWSSASKPASGASGATPKTLARPSRKSSYCGMTRIRTTRSRVSHAFKGRAVVIAN